MLAVEERVEGVLETSSTKAIPSLNEPGVVSVLTVTSSPTPGPTRNMALCPGVGVSPLSVPYRAISAAFLRWPTARRTGATCLRTPLPVT